jgi:hypothetical protein
MEESLQAAVLFLEKDPVLTGSSFGCFQNKGRSVDGGAGDEADKPSNCRHRERGSTWGPGNSGARLLPSLAGDREPCRVFDAASGEGLWLVTASLVGTGVDCCLGRLRSDGCDDKKRDLPRMLDTSSWTGGEDDEIGGRIWVGIGLVAPFLIPSRFTRRAVCGIGMKGWGLLAWVVFSLGLTGASEGIAFLSS